jgi:hypothetical protein
MLKASQTLDLDQAATLTVDELLSQVINLKAAIKTAEAQLAPLLDQLTTLADEGELDLTFDFDDWSFNWSAGRTSYDYPSEIKEIEAILKNSKKTAENDGSATRTTGKPYWTIRAPKP